MPAGNSSVVTVVPRSTAAARRRESGANAIAKTGDQLRRPAGARCRRVVQACCAGAPCKQRLFPGCASCTARMACRSHFVLVPNGETRPYTTLASPDNRAALAVADEYVRVHGARQHNLNTINVDIPRDAVMFFAGLSGSD